MRTLLRGATTMWTATFSTLRLHSTLSGKTSRRAAERGACAAALYLLKGEEDVARDKVDAPKPKKKDRLTSTNLTMIVMGRARMMSSPVFEILTLAN